MDTLSELPAQAQRVCGAEMKRDTQRALAFSRSSDDLDITRQCSAPVAPPLRRCNSDSPETPRVSASCMSLQDLLAERDAVVARARAVSCEVAAEQSDGGSDDEAAPQDNANVSADGVGAEPAGRIEIEASHDGGRCEDHCVDASAGGVVATLEDEATAVDEADVQGASGAASGGDTAAATPRAEPVAAAAADATWASPSEMSPAIRELLQPSYVNEAARRSTLARSRAAQGGLDQGTMGQGTLEKYAALRRKLWRPPGMDTVLAAAPDMGMLSDRSGYVSDASRQASSAGGGAGDGSGETVDVTDQRCVSVPPSCSQGPLMLDAFPEAVLIICSASRRRRLERLRRTLLHDESVDASTTLWPSSSSASSDLGGLATGVVDHA